MVQTSGLPLWLCPDLRAPCLDRHGMEGQLQELAHQAGRLNQKSWNNLGCSAGAGYPRFLHEFIWFYMAKKSRTVNMTCWWSFGVVPVLIRSNICTFMNDSSTLPDSPWFLDINWTMAQSQNWMKGTCPGKHYNWQVAQSTGRSFNR